jgi:hypothetical protein
MITRLARYDLRKDPRGWTVVDVWTGQPVMIDDLPLIGLEVQDADEVAEWLTWFADHGDRSIRQ